MRLLGARTLTLCAVLIAALLLVLLYPPFTRAARYAYEDVSLALVPSAERAYDFGVAHFDARKGSEYNIARAEMLFEKANALDPQLPYLQHQRARIAFLKGEYGVALERVNDEISRTEPPSSYYVRGLIRGFMGEYASAAEDYETFLRSDSHNWAALNDYAWVLLKSKRPLEALVAVDWGLLTWPENPWLLNSKATAHFELGQLELAIDAAKRAERAVSNVTEAEWMEAYPGNDPLIAGEGIRSFKNAIYENMHTIEDALHGAREDM